MRGQHSNLAVIAFSQQSVLLFLCALPAFAQLDDRTPVPSIKDQLEGRVEGSDDSKSSQFGWGIADMTPPLPRPVDSSGFLKGRLSNTDFNSGVKNNSFKSAASTNSGLLQQGIPAYGRNDFLNSNANMYTTGANVFAMNTSTNFLRGQAQQNAPLQGRVEGYTKGLHMLRPIVGDDPLNRSVRVLSGAPGLRSDAKDETLDQALSANNFVLPSAPSRPQTPKWASPNMQVDPSLSRITMSPNFAWSINGWWVDDWGYGYGRGRRYYQVSNFAMDWDSSFDSRRMRVDPSMYSQVTYPRTNVGWGVPNVPPMRIAPVPPPPVYTEQNISWDQWYQNVSSALYGNWRRGEQPGDATLRITVARGRRIDAQILKCNNSSPGFRQSLLAAVSSLNQSAVLDFPAGSPKQTVNFDSAFSAGLNTTSGAGSDRHGEIEQVTIRRR